MAAAQKLLDALGGANPPKGAALSKFLYKWCATHCVFRGDRAPKTAEALPLILYRNRPQIVRQVYVDVDGATQVVFATKSGESVVQSYTKNSSNFAVPGSAPVKTAFASTIATTAATYVDMTIIQKGTVVFVDAPPSVEGSLQHVGAGDIEHAPPPSYRIVGILDPTKAEPTETSNSIAVRVYVRGEHFVSAPYTVTVPVAGRDKFYSVEEPDDIDAISAALTTAYGNLVGLKGIKSANVTVDKDSKLRVGTSKSKTSIDKFFDSVIKPAFKTPVKGPAYAKALDTPMLHTYAATDKFNVGELDGAIASLKQAHDGAKDLREAAEALKALLFPETAAPPPSTGGGGGGGGGGGAPTQKVTELDKQVRALSAKNAALKEELAEEKRNAKRALANIKIVRLNLKGAEEQRDALQRDIDAANGARADADDARADMERERDAANAALADAEDRIRVLDAELVGAREGADTGLVAANEVLHRKQEVLEGKLRDAKDAARRVMHDRDVALGKIKNLERRLAEGGGGGGGGAIAPPGSPHRRAGQLKDLTSPEVRAARAEVDSLSDTIFALTKQLKRDPGNKDATAKLAMAMALLSVKSTKLFDLTG